MQESREVKVSNYDFLDLLKFNSRLQLNINSVKRTLYISQESWLTAFDLLLPFQKYTKNHNNGPFHSTLWCFKKLKGIKLPQKNFSFSLKLPAILIIYFFVQNINGQLYLYNVRSFVFILIVFLASSLWRDIKNKNPQRRHAKIFFTKKITRCTTAINVIK